MANQHEWYCGNDFFVLLSCYYCMATMHLIANCPGNRIGSQPTQISLYHPSKFSSNFRGYNSYYYSGYPGKVLVNIGVLIKTTMAIVWVMYNQKLGEKLRKTPKWNPLYYLLILGFYDDRMVIR